MSFPTPRALDPPERAAFLADGVRTLEELRQMDLRGRVKVGGVLLLAGAFAIVAYMAQQLEAAVAIAIIGAVGYLVARRATAPSKDGYANAFSRWRSGVIAALMDGAKLTENLFLDQGAFDSSRLNNLPYNRYSGSNLIEFSGCYACNLAVDNVRTETYYVTVTKTDASGRSYTGQEQRQRTVVDPVYHGVLIRKPISMRHRATIVISASRNLPKGLRETKVVDPILASRYKIGATDLLSVHHLLTPSKQVQISDFLRSVQALPSASYIEDTMFLALPGWTLDFGTLPSVLRTVTIEQLERIITKCEHTAAHLSDASAAWDID